jgi:DNA-binding SARP family transcriptional activator/DNA-binding CsgD family transcriptional regulator
MTTATGASTQIRVCGRLVVQIDGERIESSLPGRQGRLLFAFLLLNRHRPVRRDELIEAVWPDQSGGGDSLLAPPLSRLRKALGPGRLEGRGELQLTLPDDAWIDWEELTGSLERVRATLLTRDFAGAREPALSAVEIAEGGLLPGLEAPWIDERRRELTELRVEALEALATAGVALGGAELPGAEKAARAAVEAAPFRESARLVLMQVLRDRANIAEALRVYEDLRTLLREELGTHPGPRLAACHEQLLRAESEPDPQPAARIDSELPAPARRTGPPVVPPSEGLVERERELNMLARLVREAEDGIGRVAMIEGPAGIGKSRLLTELRHHALAEGAHVLAARASVFEREYSFGLARQLFEGMVSDPRERERLLAGSAAASRAIFTMPDEPEPDPEGPAVDASFAILHALFWLTLNVASDRPLVLALDDLQWADRASLRYVAYLVRRLEGVPILVAATVRSGEPATDPTLLDEIAHDPMAVSVRPGPLSMHAVTELIRARLGGDAEDAFCVACHTATNGNPLLVGQLISALDADHVRPTAANAEVVRDIGPRAVGRSVLLRLARLPGEAVKVARAVAVLGENAELPAIAALSGLDEVQVGLATGALARAEILRREPPIGFAHPLIHEAVYRELPPGERELEHARAAKVLADLGASPEQVSAHLLSMPRRADPWAASVLRDAGRAALRRGSADSAIAYLRRALDEPPPAGERAAYLFELGMAEAQANAYDALEHLVEAYPQVPDPLVRAQCAEICGRLTLLGEEDENALRVMQDALTSLEGATDPALVDQRYALEAVDYVSRHMGSSMDFAGLEELEKYRTVPHASAGPGLRKLVSLAGYDWARKDGSAAETARLSRVGIDETALTDELFGAVTLYTLVLAEDPAVDAGYELWQRIAHRGGSPFAGATVMMWSGVMLLERGELRDAEVSLKAGSDGLDQWGTRTTRQWMAGFLGRCRLQRGDLEGTREALDNIFSVQPSGDGAIHWLTTHARLMLAEGKPREALVDLEDVAQRADAYQNPAYEPWRQVTAQALDRLGRTDEALELAAEDLERARNWGAPGVVGHALRVLGTLEREDGIDRLREAVTVLEGSVMRLELAKALAALGSALRRARQPGESREPLRRALELAEICGADPLVEHARAELHASGARPRTEALSGVGALTASERRVVDLAADGQSNRDIAQTLFVTPKTVEVHLSNAYRKLGIRSRRELGDALAAAGETVR